MWLIFKTKFLIFHSQANLDIESLLSKITNLGDRDLQIPSGKGSVLKRGFHV